MKLYYAPGACSLSPHIVLRELGLPYELEKVDLKEKKTETGRSFLEVNPKGYVPALELEPGTVLTEGVAILQHLHSLKGDLGPASHTLEYFQTVEWLAFISTELHKNLGALFAGPNEAALERAKKRLQYVSEQLQGKKFLQGDQFTLPDAYLFTVLNWTDHLKVDLSQFPGLSEYRRRVAERPAVRKAMEEEGLLKAASSAS